MRPTKRQLLALDIEQCLTRAMGLSPQVQDRVLEALIAVEAARLEIMDRHEDFHPTASHRRLDLEKAVRKSWDEYRRTVGDASRHGQPEATLERRIACFEKIRQDRERM